MVDFLAIIPSYKMCQMKANTKACLTGTPTEHPKNLAVGMYVKWKTQIENLNLVCKILKSMLLLLLYLFDIFVFLE